MKYNLKHRAFVILGLVNEKMHEGGCHAYDINKRIEERGMRDWTNIGADFSQSTVYRTLERLENDRLVESYEEEIDGRLRNTYRITSLGYEILMSKVYDVLYSYYGKNDENFYVAFQMFPILSSEEQLEVFEHSLSRIRDHRIKIQKIYDETMINFPKLPINVSGLFIHPIKILETDEKFFKRVIKEIKKARGHIYPEDYKPKK